MTDYIGRQAQMSPDSDAPAILIIEDEPEILRDLEEGVRAEGYAVETAASGTEGLHCLNNGRPIIAVLLDVAVSRPDGFQVLREIRNAGHTLPVVMISGPAHSSIIVEAMR